MLQENVLPNISENERASIIKQVQCKLRLEKIGVIGVWVIAILTLFSIILLVTTPTLKHFNPSKNEQILSSVTSGLLEENSHKLYEFRQLQVEVASIIERLDGVHRIEIAFFVIVAGICGGILFLSVANAESSDKNPSILGVFLFSSPGLAALGFLIFLSAIQPNLKIHELNNVSEQIKAIDYIEIYVEKNYCNTFKNDEICVLSKSIDNPSKTWTSEQKVAMWNKLRTHEKEVAQRADRASKEQIRKNNELTEQIRSIKIQ